MSDTDKKIKEPVSEQKVDKKPNEGGQFYFSSFVKIKDVQTGKILLQQRCN
jgi:hypothetical protein